MQEYNFQPIVDIAEICAKKNVHHWIISPGSRSAVLTLAFSRHPEINTYMVNDERSAAFIAMGMAQQLKKTIGLICTSGSASINYGPAIAEAFYQNIPLLVLTADRPPEWIDQLDGQAINQTDIYRNYIKKSFQLPPSYENQEVVWHIHRTVSEAINNAENFPCGPVHINVPIREPFYPEKDQKWKYSNDIKIISELRTSPTLSEPEWEILIDRVHQYKKVLIIGGQEFQDNELTEILSILNFPVISDIICNLHLVKDAIKHQDIFLGNLNENDKERLKPDLIISFGKSVISKNLKIFLRKYNPIEHWHIQESGDIADTYKALTQIIRTNPIYFFRELNKRINRSTFEDSFKKSWIKKDSRISIDKMEEFFKSQKFSEFETIYSVLTNIPQKVNLHLANSMSVRYANFINLLESQYIEVFANRGTSGIDGSNSTTIGHCHLSDNLNFLITGDIAFFYDNNAFWNNLNYENLRILLLNNSGGGIFRMIKGPSEQPELNEYFESYQSQNAENLARQFDMEYYQAKSKDELIEELPSFLSKKGKAKIFEVFSDKQINKEVLQAFKAYFSN